MYDLSTDSGSLKRSIDRAQVCLNAYLWLLQVIPKPEETMALADKIALSTLLNDFKGSWTEYADFTAEIVPFETAFANHRKFFADLGVDMSKVPYMVLKDDRTEPPEIIGDTEAKARFKPEPPLLIPVPPDPNSDTMTNLVMLGAGALAVFVGFKLLKPEKRRTIGRRDVWSVGNKDYYNYGDAQKELVKRRARGERASIKRISQYLDGLGGTTEQHFNKTALYLHNAERALHLARLAETTDPRRIGGLLAVARNKLTVADSERSWTGRNDAQERELDHLWGQLNLQERNYAR